MELSIPTIDTTWQKCEQILQNMTAFSISAQNTLQFLSSARMQVLSNQSGSQQHAGMDSANQQHRAPDRPASAEPNIPNEGPPHAIFGDDIGVGQLFNWDASMGGLASDEMEFLGPFDFTDFQGWLPEEIM
jgi:hypothetical protein